MCYLLSSLSLSLSPFLSGLGIGFKLFIMDTIYSKYPKVKEKYDGLAIMWESLPTHAQVIALQSRTEDEMVRERNEDESVNYHSLSLLASRWQ